MERHPDIVLMEQIRQGAAGAFDELYEKYWEQLYAIAYNRLEDEEEAKDCVQELFIALWNKKEQIEITASVGAYLFTALKNRIFSIFRNKAVREKHTRHFYRDHSSEVNEETAFNLLDLKEFSQVIEEEIQAMPGKMREIFVLSRKNGLSVQQISLSLSLSPQTVRNQLSKAISRLRQRIDRYKAES